MYFVGGGAGGGGGGIGVVNHLRSDSTHNDGTDESGTLLSSDLSGNLMSCKSKL